MGLKRDEPALAELAAIPDDHPLAPLARLRAGQIEIRRGRTRPAEAAFLAVLKLLPHAVQPHKELVYIYNIQHRQAELDAQFLALLELNELDFQYGAALDQDAKHDLEPGGRPARVAEIRRGRSPGSLVAPGFGRGPIG